MLDGGEDLRAVANDATLERDERFDAAAPCPGDPSVQCLGGLVDGEFDDRPSVTRASNDDARRLITSSGVNSG